MEYKIIEEKITNVFLKMFNIVADKVDNDAELTGYKFELDAYELMLFIMEIESVFNIKFEQKQIENYGLNTLNKISLAVNLILNGKEV